MTDLRLGRWQDVLGDVECDALICDPPYGERTHTGHGTMARYGQSTPPCYDGSSRRDIDYTHMTPDGVAELVASWAPRTRRWMVCMTDTALIPVYQAAYEAAGWYAFARSHGSTLEAPCACLATAPRRGPAT